MNQLVSAIYPWMLSIVILVGALALGVIVHWVVFIIVARVARRTPFPIDDLLIRHARRPARLLTPLLVLSMVLPSVALPPAAMDITDRLLGIALIGAVAWLLSALLSVLTEWIALQNRIDVADNLTARRVLTQAKVLRRTAATVIVIVAGALMLMRVPGIEGLGASLLASAGLAGIVVGLAARPMLSNLMAGLQLALTQPIRLDDVVIVEGEWGRVEEIGNTYVVVRIWDLRRMVLPLTYFIERPFQNWTREGAELLGTVYVHADYATPVDEVRAELHRILQSSGMWDGKVWGLQVTDATDRTIALRALLSASDSSTAWDLRCHVRERLIAFLQQRHPQALPRTRAELHGRAAEREDGLPGAKRRADEAVRSASV